MMRHTGFRPCPRGTNELTSYPPPTIDVQITAAHLAILLASAVPMELLIAALIVVDMSVCGGSILLDGGQRETYTKLVVEDCEIHNAHASHLGGAIFQVGTTHLVGRCRLTPG